MRLSLAVLGGLLAAASLPARSQSALHTANGAATIILREDAGLSLDLNESKFTGTLLFGYSQTVAHPNWLGFVANVSLAAKKGRRDLFASGDFNPEFALDLTAEHSIESPPSAPRSSYTRLFVTLGGAAERQKYVATTGAAIDATGNALAKTLNAVVGANLGFTEDHVLGLGIRGIWRSNSVHEFDARVFCVTQATGTGATGSTSVENCETVALGTPRSLAGGQARFDWMRKVKVPADAGVAESNTPTVGILVSGATDFFRGGLPRYNLSVGPTLHPLGNPSALYGAVLFEWADLTNNSGKKSDERFFVRMYARVPFALF